MEAWSQLEMASLVVPCTLALLPPPDPCVALGTSRNLCAFTASSLKEDNETETGKQHMPEAPWTPGLDKALLVCRRPEEVDF